MPRTVKAATYAIEDRGYETPCWVWQGWGHGQGYGTLSVNGRTTLAHRHYYETHVGPIPDGLVIDHLCCVRPCVNPEHLEAVTQEENMRRSRKETCRRGHPMSGDNLLVLNRRHGERICRTCKREDQRARYHALSPEEKRARNAKYKKAKAADRG